jgi:hypothetical protein
MTDIRHYRNGTLVNPRNFDNAKIVMDWIGTKESAKITIDSIELVGQEGKELRDRILSGLSGGVGFFEGEPYQIQIGEQSNPQGTFDGFLDFSSGVEFIGDCDVRCTLKREQGSDWLNDVADGFSYRYLESIGLIQNEDFQGVPYVINYIPDGAILLILGVSLFSMTKELIESIKAVGERTADLTDAAIPVTGVSAGFGGGAVTAVDVGNIVLAALKLILQIAYTVLIIVAIVKLIEQIIEQLMPPKRVHLGMSIKKLFEKGCEHLNLTLQSSLLDDIDVGERWVLIPSKNHRGGEKPTNAGSDWRETGVPSQQDATDTFGGVIRTFKRMFNADFQIRDGVFIFERVDFFRNQSNYVIPDTFIEQEKFIDTNTFNTSEIKSNYVISYAFDSQDLNTLDVPDGRVFQAQLSPNVTVNENLTTMKGLEEIAIPFSLPVRKNSLTAIEEAVKFLVSIADALTGQLGNPQSLSGKISNRIGAMHLSSHFLSLPKLAVMTAGQLQLEQRQILAADKLWTNYHFLNSFKSIDGQHNQYYLYSQQKIPFCFADFLSLLNNNKVTTASGEDAEIESVEWNVWNDFALIDYRVNRLYDNNFKITYL